MIIKGRAWLFGDNISTDDIFPNRCKHLCLDNKELMGQYAMTGADPKFPKKVQKGDIIISPINFGCGSSREQAAICLKQVGIGAVISGSFGRIFYRNCINNALPVIRCSSTIDILDVKEGDIIGIDLEQGVITNTKNNKTQKFEKMPEFLLNIIKEGGLIAHGRKLLKDNKQ